MQVTDYFQVFGISPRLLLDPDQLKKTYYQLSRENHPDFYQKKTSDERMSATEKTSLLNKAYEVLRDPFRRVEHVLSLQGYDVNKDLGPVSADLLAEVFEIQENLDLGNTPRALLDEEAVRLKGRIEKLTQTLHQISREWDNSSDKPGQQALAEKVLRIIHEKKYIDSTLKNIQRGL